MNNQLLIIIVIIVALYIIHCVSNKKIIEEKFLTSLTPTQLNEVDSLCLGAKERYMIHRYLIGHGHDFSIRYVKGLC